MKMISKVLSAQVTYGLTHLDILFVIQQVSTKCVEWMSVE